MTSFLQVKIAAARANFRLENLSARKLAAIEKACAQILETKPIDQFPVDMLQGGAGTSSNMNVNEVVANFGLEYLGLPKGSYRELHPNDDVNRSQSTNDVFPTAARMALVYETAGLQLAMDKLADAFSAKGDEFHSILKLGRTQLQDAVPMTLGQEFMAFAVAIRADTACLMEACNYMRTVNLSGTAIGTGLNAPPGYQTAVLHELNAVSGLDLRPAADLVAASWDTGAFVGFSSQLKRLAIKLSKIANDLRLLSSGPTGGIGELQLPVLQPGSSIMPGKVNPVIPEAVNQVAFHIVGADVTVTLAAEAGQLQLNAFEPLIITSILGSVGMLTNVARLFTTRCVIGIKADTDRCAANLQGSTALAAALVPIIGYEKATALAKAKLATGQSIEFLLGNQEVLSGENVALELDAMAVSRHSSSPIPDHLELGRIRPQSK